MLFRSGGFGISFVASSSSRLRVMWLSNILSASTNLAFMVFATITDKASIEASILSSRRASTVSSSDASPVYSLSAVPVPFLLFRVSTFVWSVVTCSSKAVTFFASSLSYTVPSRVVYFPSSSRRWAYTVRSFWDSNASFRRPRHSVYSSRVFLCILATWFTAATQFSSSVR